MSIMQFSRLKGAEQLFYKTERSSQGSYDFWYIYITKTGNKAMIYKENGEGVVLKR